MSSEVPKPQHLSTTSSPLVDHDLYFHESQLYTRLYDRFNVGSSQVAAPPKVTPDAASVRSVFPPSPAILERALCARRSARQRPESPDKVLSLPHHVNSKLDSPDELDTEKLHPSGYVAPGWKWNSFRTPTTSKIVVDCRLTAPPLVEAPKHKIQRLLDVSGIPPPHPGFNYDHTPAIPSSTIAEHGDKFYNSGLLPASFPGYYCTAEYSGPKNFLKMEVYDTRGTVLVLPTEINIENFLSSEIGKMFVHVRNRSQLEMAINKGLNCLVSCASLGKYALQHFPAINFNPRLFRVPSGVHCYNPEGIKIQIILQMIYYQGETLLTLFERCRWMVGSDVVELDHGGNHPT